jgi:DNA-binding transcriptional ArsR family regulator
MPSDKIRVLSEVGPMRALAHPTRLDLLDLLRVHESLTASRCAELLGLSPKTCSYHLHVLAREGLIEEAAGGPTARERPWRRAYDETWLADPKLADPQPADPQLADQGNAGDDGGLGAARREVLQVIARRDGAAILRFAASLDQLPVPWPGAVTWYGRTALMTPAELRGWGEAVEAVTREHVRRANGHAQRPAGQEPGPEVGPAQDSGAAAAGRRPVRLLVHGFPDQSVPGRAP